MSKKIYNEDGRDIGLIISCYQQGSQWVANITNDSIDYWYELKLGYWINSESQVIEWAKEYAEDDRFELRL